ncbi:hypothetical protein BDU57DRAFT_61165 [Ampelomyces quisqualis]|uniref:Uncharacterized protein n=1 Tax=Ampelomyces quisqualis TaxID=50730 RepID=A0A6A5R3I9_AMPQU|nr:hypothetical protein BDU57DRAFT_61165 [Ampelomyces quisqualis]
MRGVGRRRRGTVGRRSGLGVCATAWRLVWSGYDFRACGGSAVGSVRERLIGGGCFFSFGCVYGFNLCSWGGDVDLLMQMRMGGVGGVSGGGAGFGRSTAIDRRNMHVLRLDVDCGTGGVVLDFLRGFFDARVGIDRGSSYCRYRYARHLGIAACPPLSFQIVGEEATSRKVNQWLVPISSGRCFTHILMTNKQ